MGLGHSLPDQNGVQHCPPMTVLHNILFYPALVLITCLISLPIFLVQDPAGKLASGVMRLWSKAVLLFAGVRVQADLAAAPPEDGPYVFMANHQSFMDVPILTATLGEHYPRFVAKESLFKVPVFGYTIGRAGNIPIDRENPRKAIKAIQHASQMLENGQSVVIFPEGTRQTDTSRLGEFGIGGMVMALKCKRPVVPVIVTGSAATNPRGSYLVRPGTVTVTALAPIHIADEYTVKERERLRDDLHTRMDAAYRKLMARPPEAD